MDRYREGVRAPRQEGDEPTETICPKCKRRVKVDDHARGAKERNGARVDPRPLMRRYIERGECQFCWRATFTDQRRLHQLHEAKRLPIERIATRAMVGRVRERLGI